MIFKQFLQVFLWPMTSIAVAYLTKEEGSDYNNKSALTLLMRPPTSSLFITSSSVVVNGEYNSAVRKISWKNKINGCSSGKKHILHQL